MNRRGHDGADLNAASFESLYDLFAKLAVQDNLDLALNEVLLASLGVVAADGGYIRLFDFDEKERDLSHFPFVASKGMSNAYIKYWASLDQPADRDARATIFNGGRIIIEDMMTHPSFLAHRKPVLSEGYRSMQVTPLMSRNGSRCVGAIFTCFKDAYTPPAETLDMLDLYAEIAANALEHHQQVAQLERRDSLLTAVRHQQSDILWRIQKQAREIEDRAAASEIDEVRHLAHFLVRQIQSAQGELGSPQPAEEVADSAGQPGNPYGLSDREMEVLMCLWEGLSDKQIGRRLGISRFTVAKHVGAVIRKMNVETRTQAGVIVERDALYRRIASKR